ncbi:beta-hexosaminidase subunit beta-like isoform X1 [Pieris brassicae]|uniref:beta-hexosaminidase subunit beta-like isoform X1 n=1 Tax=Pieris brassicae TaxID=7116 RepID=UPI001E660D4A|nr:beta-hexosaminidase subunit beta-like isoform X1 [Pieris brassicae]
MCFKKIVLVTLLLYVSQCVEISGPKFRPSKGAVWPKPKKETREEQFYNLHSSSFNFKVTDKTCSILLKAINRYSGIITNLKMKNAWSTEVDSRENFLGFLTHLEVILTQPCEEYPSYGMDESYTLTILSTPQLKSASIWGILRGLETFSQLLYYSSDYTQIHINKNIIEDSPSYIHRGLLLDTARHYISVNRILETLDAMSYNKMNVFHWHMVDDQSFPYQSERFPELSEKGAYAPWMVYTKADIQKIIEHARDRGIRVIPEFDVPGHSRAWGNAFPGILTKCGNSLGPMDPSSDSVYNIVQELYRELKTIFPDDHFHLGGDEVDTDCWSKNPSLMEYIKEKGIEVNKIQNLFMETMVPLVNDSKLIVWEETFTSGLKLPKDTIVQVWKYKEVARMKEVLSAGHKVIYSSQYYLDFLQCNWEFFYKYDPREMMKFVGNLNLDDIIGGEACMWSEKVNDANVISRVWPRASAFAERFWSGGLATASPPIDVYRRIEEHTCRMIQRGISAEPPSGPGLC